MEKLHRLLTARMLMGELQNDLGISREQAAGVVGNLMHESGGFSKLQEMKPLIPGSRGGYGYAQWTGPRRREFEKFAAENKISPDTYQANYGNLKREMTQGPEAAITSRLKTAPDASAAARAFSAQFLRPGIPHNANRVALAGALANDGNAEIRPPAPVPQPQLATQPERAAPMAYVPQAAPPLPPPQFVSTPPARPVQEAPAQTAPLQQMPPLPPARPPEMMRPLDGQPEGNINIQQALADAAKFFPQTDEKSGLLAKILNGSFGL